MAASGGAGSSSGDCGGGGGVYQEGDMNEIRAILHEYFAAVGGSFFAAMGMGYR